MAFSTSLHFLVIIPESSGSLLTSCRVTMTAKVTATTNNKIYSTIICPAGCFLIRKSTLVKYWNSDLEDRIKVYQDL